MKGKQPSERTPLLRSITERTEQSQEHETSVLEGDVRAIEEVGQGALEPGIFPELGKQRSYSHSHWLAPDEDASGRPEAETTAQFEENGLLSGLSRTRFWFIFGGILLGYFVSQR
jgi:hypothetical protein